MSIIRDKTINLPGNLPGNLPDSKCPSPHLGVKRETVDEFFVELKQEELRDAA